MLDVAIIGSGPAGVAAAINVRQRNRSLVLLGAAEVSRKLESAQEIANYPGFPEIGGAALGEAFHRHLDALGIAVERKYVDHVYPMGDFYALTSGEEMWEARSVVLATGVTAFKPIEGEIELLGRGVSYCATCDGRLYKGRPVLALAYDEDAEEEYTIVGSQEANPMEGCISDDSPFGFALKGHKVGETVTVTAPVGELQFKIIAVENED